MTPLKLETIDLQMRYDDYCVLEDMEIHVKEREFITLVGASGCGKSTLLNIIAGLLEPTSGQVLLDGEPVTGPGPDRGVVFQSYSLYPWRTVSENVAFGLEIQKLSKEEIKERVDEFLRAMGLARVRDSLPRELSGGMKQRVAIARALATRPEILLLDEPFGALDSQTRTMMQDLLLDAWRHPGTCDTILFVTHDVDEAVFLSERIYMLSSNPGRVAEEIVIPFGRDRTQDVLRDPIFHDLVDYVRDRLKVWAPHNTTEAEPAD